MLLEALDVTVRDRTDLTRLVTVPPLAVIPWLETWMERRARRRRRSYALAGATTALLTGIVMTHLFLKPLDVLWAVALRRLGG